MLKALHLAGAEQLAAGGTRSLDIPIFEGGQGLSSGQRQFVLLARTLIGQPQVLMLDEPTSNMDDAAEALAIARLKDWMGTRTLVLVSHRMAALQLVDRICVVDGGRVVLDGQRDEVLARLAGKSPSNAAAGNARPSATAPAATRAVSVLQQPRAASNPARFPE